MKKTLYYAEIYFKGHFIPWSVYRTGFKPDIPRMDSEHLYSSLEDLEDAILRAKDECADDTIDEIRRESVEVYTCRDCGMEFDQEEMHTDDECGQWQWGRTNEDTSRYTQRMRGKTRSGGFPPDSKTPGTIED